MDEVDQLIGEAVMYEAEDADREISQGDDEARVRVYRTGGSIEVSRNASGKYTWQIKWHEGSLEEILAYITKISKRMEAEFGIGR